MYGKKITKEYERWSLLCKDEALLSELKEMKDHTDTITQAFGEELTFGTGGLRGKIGVGTSKMNVYTVRKATAGLCKYLSKHTPVGVAIGYDTRKYSRKFAEICAEVLSSYGIKSYVYSAPLPTPMLSYAVRSLQLSAGIMITASHNPAVYNGYKVYGSDGCQITDEVAEEILNEINSSDYFDNTNYTAFDELIRNGNAEYIGDYIYQNYLADVMKCSVVHKSTAQSDLRIVYTPLNGTGYKPVTDILKKAGFENLYTVEEQELPDEEFSTCKKPNPELDEALVLSLEYAKREDADIVIATDPDCDRVGVIAKKGGEYKRLTGNEVGLLLLDFIISRKEKTNSLSSDSTILKTIVTTPLAEKIAKAYNVKLKNLLTGFKYIGEEIGRMEKSEDFLFGFEESCGYLGGTYVRDKDGVFAALLVSEMSAFYKFNGLTLWDRLEKIYETYGYCTDKLISHEFDSLDGKNKILKIMDLFRNGSLPSSLSVTVKEDYLEGLNGLPVSDVISFAFEGGETLTVRPSGTEPKIKFYYYTIGKNELEAKEKMTRLIEKIEDFIK